MSGEITVGSGYQFNLETSETVTLSKLNALGKPNGRVNAGAINTRELADQAVTSDKLSEDILAQINADASVGNGAITTQNLADGAVTIDKLESNLNRIMRTFITPAAVYIPVSGTLVSIAANYPGWKFADGSAYTTDLGAGNVLDLRDKFIVGGRQDDAATLKSNITGSLLQTGGDISHTHTVTGIVGGTAITVAQIPDHTHLFTDQATVTEFTKDSDSATAVGIGTGSSVARHIINTNEGGTNPTSGVADTHTHTFGTGLTNSQQHVNPFFALAIITYVGVTS